MVSRKDANDEHDEDIGLTAARASPGALTIRSLPYCVLRYDCVLCQGRQYDYHRAACVLWALTPVSKKCKAHILDDELRVHISVVGHIHSTLFELDDKRLWSAPPISTQPLLSKRRVMPLVRVGHTQAYVLLIAPVPASRCDGMAGVGLDHMDVGRGKSENAQTIDEGAHHEHV